MTQEELQSLGQTIMIWSGIASVIGGSFWKWGRPKLSAWWEPYRDGIQGVKDMPVKLKEITEKQDRNHETNTKAHEAAIAKIDTVVKDVSTLTSTMRARADANPHEAYFEFNADGLLIGANKTFTRWVNREMREILGYGWKNTIHWKDRDRAVEEITEAVVECRSVSLRFKLIDETLVELTMAPIPEGQMPCEKFIGVIRRVRDDDRRVAHDTE